MKGSYPRLAALLLLAAAPVLPPLAHAQEFSVGADFMSRYVWRGFDFGESFSVQPTLEFTQDAFTVGTWASYSISADGSGANEHDLYVSIAAGPVSFGITDYYFPSGVVGFNGDGSFGVGADEAPFFDIESHVFEPFVSVESGGLSLYGAFLLNSEFSGDFGDGSRDGDTDFAPYVEVGYGFEVAGTELALAAGGILTESAFYGNTSPALSNLSISAAKAIPITDTFSIPVGVSYIINPYSERTFLVFGISL